MEDFSQPSLSAAPKYRLSDEQEDASRGNVVSRECKNPISEHYSEAIVPHHESSARDGDQYQNELARKKCLGVCEPPDVVPPRIGKVAKFRIQMSEPAVHASL